MSPADAAAIALALAVGVGAGQEEITADGLEPDYGVDTVPDDGNVRIQNNSGAPVRCARIGAGVFDVPKDRTYVLVGSPVSVRCPSAGGQVSALESGERYYLMPAPGGAELRKLTERRR